MLARRYYLQCWIHNRRRTMKKLFLILLAIGAVSVNALSSPVSPSQAKETAARFFGTSSSSPRMIVGGRSVLSTTYVSDPAYYIFNNDGGGFVIVAGDDCLEPILGYSLKGAIDESSMPENMLFWLDGIRRSVQFLRRHARRIRTTGIVLRSLRTKARNRSPVAWPRPSAWS